MDNHNFLPGIKIYEIETNKKLNISIKVNIFLCGLGDYNSADVSPCKRRLIMGYKLSYTTGLLGLLACSEAYEFEQLGTVLSWFR